MSTETKALIPGSFTAGPTEDSCHSQPDSPPQRAGECDLCGNFDHHLVAGVCDECQRRYRPRDA